MTTIQDVATAQTEYDKAANARVTAQSLEHEKLMILNALKEKFAKEQEKTFCLVNESNLSAMEMLTHKLGIEDYLPEVLGWGFGKINISISALQPTDIPIYITNRKGKFRIAGYHDVENGKPVAYVKPGTAYSRFGYYHPASRLLKESMTLKTFGVVIHELMEILGNPLRNTFSEPDSQGRQWYREITDHVHGNEFMKVINGVKCVFPDCALPNFYKVGATTDLSIRGNLTKPFTLTPKGYGYFKGDNGALTQL